MNRDNEDDRDNRDDRDDEDDEEDFLGDIGLSLSENPQLDDALILRLTYDLATRLHNPRAIAARYGLDGVEALREYLRDHPEVVAEARRLNAIFQSDGAAEDRVRMKFLHATERLIIPMAGIVADPRTPLGARIDGFKQIQRGAGLDGMTQNQKLAQQKADGAQPFNLTINFSGGRAPLTISGETVATTVVDHERLRGDAGQDGPADGDEPGEDDHQEDHQGSSHSRGDQEDQDV